jgi:pimeloyl-ACP methyl ester carboxylesterase
LNRLRWLRRAAGGAALAAIAFALVQLQATGAGVRTETTSTDGTPVTIFRPVSGGPGPAVLIAHGFAGSQQLMQPFAVTLARQGYTAVTFDFAGHGRNPTPLTGSITREDGATRTLVAETARVAALAKTLGDGRLALLGHSMATDIIVRHAQADPGIAATVAVSMFSPAVTATTPRNLLVVVGAWEGGLQAEALRVTGLVSAPAPAETGVTYGDPATGGARRVAVSPHTEHVGVLYSETSLREALAWLDTTFGRPPAAAPDVDGRGPMILLLLAGVVLLAWPLAGLLPVVASPPAGAGLGWRRIWLPIVAPAVATPLLLRLVPTTFLPVIVGDYLAVHFAAYGIITALVLAAVGGRSALPRPGLPGRPLVIAAVASIAFGFIAIVWPIDSYVTSFVPNASRLVLFLAMLAGTLCFFLGDEWLTRGLGAAHGAYVASKVAFLVSLGMAVALDFERLFFLLIIIPVIVVFFVVYGLFSAWAYRATGHPFVAGTANAVAFAWAIAVTFPFLAR